MPWTTDPNTGQRFWVDPTTGKAQLRDKYGRLYEQAPEHVAASIGTGRFTPATAEDLERHAAEQAPFSEKALTLGESALSAAWDTVLAPAKHVSAWETWLANQTIGRAAGIKLPDPLSEMMPISGRQVMRDLGAVIEHTLGGESEVMARELEEGMRERARRNPISATAGRVMGEVAVAAPFGFLGAAPRTAAGMLGAGVTEGAVLGTGQAAEEAFLLDIEQTAETTLAAMGVGALLGGGVALGLHGLGRLFRRTKPGRYVTRIDGPEGTAATDDAYEQVAEQMFGQPVKPGFGAKMRGALEWARDQAEKSMARRTGQPLETLQRYGPFRWDKAAREGRDLAANRDEVLMKMTDEASEALDDLMQAQQVVAEPIRQLPWKRSLVARNLEGIDGDAALTAARGAYQEARNTLAQMTREARAAAVGIESGAKMVRLKAGAPWIHEFNQWTAGMNSALRRADPPDAYIALDHIRRAAQKRVTSLRRAAANASDDRMMQTKYQQADVLDGLQERLRQHLMDEAVWGRQGAVQRSVNHAWTRLLEVSRDAESVFSRRLQRREWETGRQLQRVDPGKVHGLLSNMGLLRRQVDEDLVRRYVDDADEFAAVVAKHYELPAGADDAAKKLAAASQRLRRVFAGAQETVGTANQINAMLKADAAWSPATMLTGGAVGGVLGGLPGAFVGAGLALTGRPGHLLRILEPIMANRGHMGDKIGGLVDSVFARWNKVGKAAEAKALEPVKPTILARVSEEAKEVARHARRRGATALLRSGFADHGESPREAYQRRTEEIARWQAQTADPEQWSQTLGELPTAAPQLAQTMVLKANQGMAYLHANMPAPGMNLNSLTPHLELPRVSEHEIREFAERWAGVNAPLSILEDLRDGRLTREKVEAVKAVWPRLYQAMRWYVMLRLREQKQRLPYEGRLQLDMLLDLDGQAEPTAAPDFLARATQIHAERAAERQAALQQQQARARKPQIARFAETQTDSILTLRGA